MQCDRCDAVSETLTVAAGDSLGHSYQNGVCVRCGALMPVTPFDDVPDDAYYTEAVYWAKRCGITNGVSSTCFAPNATCTRAQSVTFLWNAAGKPEPSSLTVPFTDVSADAYYYKALCWAVERKITNGTSGTTFSPNGIVTRAQAVTMMWRAAGSPEPTASEMTFTDVKADSYYYKAVLWAVENKITSGMSDTLFAPDATCSRSQIVTFLYRMQNSPESKAENPFTDVKADAYYANAVLWAVENGVTTGASATTFDPAGDCTRGQIVTFLYRCLSK